MKKKSRWFFFFKLYELEFYAFAGENDEMVKLYNLTDLCKDKIITAENPFTVYLYMIFVCLEYLSVNCIVFLFVCLFVFCFFSHLRCHKAGFFPPLQECAEAHFHLSDMWVPNKSMNDIWQDKKIPAPVCDIYL